MRGEEEQLLPEALFDLPEVGGLAGEGGAMDLVEGTSSWRAGNHWA